MNSDQEKLLQGLAVCRKIRQRAGQTADGRALFTDWAVPEEITALAQVVLELVEKAEHPLHVIHHGEQFTYRRGFGPGDGDAGARDPSTLLWKLRQYVTEYLLSISHREHDPHQIVDGILAMLDADPGHDVSAHVIRPGKDRGTTVAIYREFIQAIRRGE